MTWFAFVAFGIVIGWGFNPRSDEIAFMLAVPLIVVVPYAVICLVLAVVKASWPIGLKDALGRVRLAGLQSYKRIRNRP